MKHKLCYVVSAVGVVGAMICLWNNPNHSKDRNVDTSENINLSSGPSAGANEKAVHTVVTKSEGAPPQIEAIPNTEVSDQITTQMDSYQTKLIQKAEKLIDRAKSIPPGIDPVVETKGDFTVVSWPIPRAGGNLVPGPANYAAVHFRKGTFDVEGVLGAH